MQRKARRAFCNWCGNPYITTDGKKMTDKSSCSYNLSRWKEVSRKVRPEEPEINIPHLETVRC